MTRKQEEANMPLDPDAIRDVPLFTSLEPVLLDRIAAISTVRSVPMGEWLFRVGEHPSCLFAVYAGQVALGQPGVGGEFVAVEVLRAGEFFGTPAVLIERPSVVSAQTLEPSEIVCIAAQGLRELLRSEPAVASAMLVSLSTSYRALVRQVFDLKSRSVAQRLGCYLLSIADEQGTTTEILLPFEKRLLASRLGTTPESLSRAFGVLRTCNVSTLGRKVSLGNLAELTHFARPDQVV
jgi:CRP/FNR family transcriptional activator FtrB